jgi:geranylgeranyl diphosphate synthase, type I
VRTIATIDVKTVSRSAWEVLGWSRSIVEPVLRAAVDTLPSSMLRIVGYHFGWWNEHGVSEVATGGEAI